MPNYKLTFYVPPAHCDEVKAALFAIGVGRIGNYDCCAWQTVGEGQYRPLSGSNPTIGEQGRIEQLPEIKVEMICAESLLQQAVATLKSAHPYEEPAYDVWPLMEI